MKKFNEYKETPSLFTYAQTDSLDRIELTVSKKELVSPDTYKFELEFPNKEWISGFWPGAHCFFCAEINGEEY